MQYSGCGCAFFFVLPVLEASILHIYEWIYPQASSSWCLGLKSGLFLFNRRILSYLNIFMPFVYGTSILLNWTVIFARLTVFCHEMNVNLF